MPYEAYIGYLTDDDQVTRDEVREGKPFVMEVRDQDTFERLVVKAVVAEPPEKVEGGDELWVLDWVEERCEAPWSIRILEELDEEVGAERSDVSDADLKAASEEAKEYGGKKYRGAQLADSMGGDEARKYYENVVAKKRKGK